MALTEGAPTSFIQALGGGSQQYVAMLMFDPLVQVDILTSAIMPDLAQSWSVSSDGLTWTFNLFQNVTWHDGVKFTSADVKYTFDYINQNSLSGKSFLGGISNIQTPDDHTVVITLKAPDSSFLVKVNGRYSGLNDIMPMHILQGTNWANDTSFQTHPIGTGPYKFQSFDGSTLIMVRNDNYFMGRPAFAQINAKVITSVNIADTAFQSGELDYLYNQFSSFATYNQLKSLSGVGSATYSLFMETLEFNVNRAPFNNTLVRQAVELAINKSEVNQKVFLGAGHPQNNPVFPDWLISATNSSLKAPAYNIAQANALLDQAGFPKGAGGTRFTVQLSYANPYPPPTSFVDVLKADLSLVGINVVANPNEWDVWYQQVYTNKDFQMSLHHMIVVGSPLVGLADEVVPGKLYYYGYNNTQVQSLYAQAAAATTQSSAAQIYGQIQKILSKDVPYIGLVDYPTPIVWRTNVVVGNTILKGDIYRFRYVVAAPVTPTTTTTTTTPVSTTPTTTTTETGGTDYTTYAIAAVVIVAILILVYAVARRRPTAR